MTDKKKTTVALVRCTDYGTGSVFASVKRSIDLVGGIGAFVKPGQRVLIKPNLLKAKMPHEAVTTHPEIVRAVIKLVHAAGAHAMVGDSPGMGDLRRVAEKAGILDVIAEEKAVLAELDEAVSVKSTGRFQRFEVARRAREADVIINLPKLKTHGMTTITGAVKNLFGCVPGKRKVQWHFNAGVNHGLFMIMLVELCSLLGPSLTVMDAVVGMEGNGPGSGDPRHLGVLLAGADPVAVDTVAGALVGVDPHRLPILQAAAAASYGIADLGRISIMGDPLESAAVNDFRLPPQAHLEWRLPEWARRSMKNAFTSKPVIDADTCELCGICLKHCPQTAIEHRKGRLQIRYRDCIRCFCCQEFCPRGAITVTRGWALKIG